MVYKRDGIINNFEAKFYLFLLDLYMWVSLQMRWHLYKNFSLIVNEKLYNMTHNWKQRRINKSYNVEISYELLKYITW